jgi:hypothetical protein
LRAFLFWAILSPVVISSHGARRFFFRSG